jgi:hypothetical protein
MRLALTRLTTPPATAAGAGFPLRKLRPNGRHSAAAAAVSKMSGVQALPNPAAASRLAATRTEALARAELDALRASGPIQRDGGSATPEWPSATQQAMEKQEAAQVKALSLAATTLDAKGELRAYRLIYRGPITRAAGCAVLVARASPAASARQLSIPVPTTSGSVVEVTDEKDGWLRVRAALPPGAPSNFAGESYWVQQRDDAKGVRWARCRAVAPQFAATQLMAATGLQMLLFSLERDPEACVHLVGCASELVRELKPLALYSYMALSQKQGHPESAIGRVSNFVLSLAAKQLPDDAARASEMMSLVLRLAAARGSLHANLEVVQAVLETPALLQPEHLECLELLVAVDSCEDELLMEQFGPTPGSAKYLMSAWDKDIFPTLKAAHNASEPPPAYVMEIFEALKACDVEKARGIARPHVKKAQAYIAYAKKRRQALALPQEGGAPEKSAKAIEKEIRAEWQVRETHIFCAILYQK